MFEPQEEFSSDLDYLLTSGEVEPDLLLEALMDEFYPAVYRLALACLDDRDEALFATLETFIAAQLNAYSFLAAYSYQNEYSDSLSQPGIQASLGVAPHRNPGGENRVKIWLYSQALDILRHRLQRLKLRRALHATLHLPAQPSAFGASAPATELDAALWLALDGLPEGERIPLLLQTMQGWTNLELAALYQTTGQAMLAQTTQAWSKLGQALSGAGYTPESLLSGRSLDESLEQSLARRWREAAYPLPEHEAMLAELQHQAAHRGTKRRVATHLREIVLVGISILVVAGVLWGANRLIPDPEGIASITPTSISNHDSREADNDSSIVLNYFPQVSGVTLQELADQLEIPARLLQRVNGFPLDQALRPGYPVRVPIPDPGSEPPDPTPVPPVAHRFFPLGIGTDSATFREYLAQSNSLWHTLWADAQLFEYGPPGYVGPPLVYRAQVWASQPGAIRELLGPWPGAPSTVTLAKGNWVYKLPVDPNSQGLLSEKGDSISNDRFFGLLFPSEASWFKLPGEFRVARNIVQPNQVAGREVVVVDWQYSNDYPSYNGPRHILLWIDAMTGIVLRMQYYGGPDRTTLLREIIITNLAYDVNFPDPSIFTPYGARSRTFAQDFTGQPLPATDHQAVLTWATAAGHEPLSRRQPPANLDLAHSALTFQFAQPSLSGGTLPAADGTAEIFAGPYFLGSLPLSDPWYSICDRSPDGKKIAYLGSGPNNQGSQLQWFDLTKLGETQSHRENVDPADFAFAPDSRRLAYFTYGSPTLGAGIYVLDTQTGKQTLLISMNFAQSLAWSPDGSYIAMVGSVGIFENQEEALVVRSDSGQVVYHKPIDRQALQNPASLTADWPAPDFPVHTWGINFPVYRYALQACTEKVGG